MSEILGEFRGQPIVSVSRVEGVQAILDPCPLCGETHHHGNGRDWDDRPPEYSQVMHKGITIPSHRVAHCHKLGPGGYYIVYTEDTENLRWGEDGFEVPDR